MDFFGEIIVRLVLGVVWWLVLFPVLWLTATLPILVLARFQEEPYSVAVRRMYSSVTDFWIDYGMLFTP